jgi:hypothetical protein
MDIVSTPICSNVPDWKDNKRSSIVSYLTTPQVNKQPSENDIDELVDKWDGDLEELREIWEVDF